MRQSIISCAFAVMFLFSVAGDCRADESERSSGSQWRIALSGGYGLVSTFQADQLGWDLSPQRDDAFFEPAASFSIRIGKGSKDETGFRGCIDVSFYYFSVALSTYYRDPSDPYAMSLYHLGYVRGRWLLVTPGWQRLDIDGSGLTMFLGLGAVGLAINQFTVNPYLLGEAAEKASEIDLGSSFIVALIPAKAEWVFARKFSVGVSFSGILLSKPDIDAPPSGENWRRPEGEDLNLSNIHMHATLGVWL